MRTVHAVRVSGPRRALRPQAQALVVQWLESRFPYDERSAGTSVRVVDEAAWFRVVVDQHVDASLTSQIVVSLRSDDRGLAFEARQVMIPRQVRVVRRTPRATDRGLLDLVKRMVDLIGPVDAGVRMSATGTVVTTEIEAAGIAALCEAPSRALPVLVETASPAGVSHFRAERAGGALAGLAHVVVLADDRTRKAFNEAWGAELLPASALALVWPDRAETQVWDGSRLTEKGAQHTLVAAIEEVVSAAAASLPSLPRPRPDAVAEPAQPVESRPRTATSTPTGPTEQGDADVGSTVSMDELIGVLDELEQAWNRVDDLQGAVAAADAMVAKANARSDTLERQIDDLVQAKVDLEIRLGRRPTTLRAANASDAVAQARELCRHLVFVGGDRDLSDLSAIDASALLVDLVKLDAVAVQWMTGDITDTTFSLACRNVGLDFASGISDTAEQEFAQDYAIEWKGQTVLAVAHLRRGRGAHHYRIHLYLDRERRQVVVGHIGRHLRGKRG